MQVMQTVRTMCACSWRWPAHAHACHRSCRRSARLHRWHAAVLSPAPRRLARCSLSGFLRVLVGHQRSRWITRNLAVDTDRCVQTLCVHNMSASQCNVQDASPAVKATVVQPDIVRHEKLQVIDGRFVDYRWVSGRWVLSEFASANGVMDYAAWEKVRFNQHFLAAVLLLRTTQPSSAVRLTVSVSAYAGH